MEGNTAASLLFLHVFALDLDSGLQGLRGEIEHIVRLQGSNFVRTIAGLFQGNEDALIPQIWCMTLSSTRFHYLLVVDTSPW